MSQVTEYDDLKTPLSKVLDFLPGGRGVVTVRHNGVPVVRITPMRVCRMVGPESGLFCEIKRNFFEDRSSDREDV